DLSDPEEIFFSVFSTVPQSNVDIIAKAEKKIAPPTPPAIASRTEHLEALSRDAAARQLDANAQAASQNATGRQADPSHKREPQTASAIEEKRANLRQCVSAMIKLGYKTTVEVVVKTSVTYVLDGIKKKLGL